jgi:hypothetical protein
MTLDHLAKYPSDHCYVLKLHRDAAAHPEAMTGRLENMANGRQHDFRSGAELLRLLAFELAAPARPSP